MIFIVVWVIFSAIVSFLKTFVYLSLFLHFTPFALCFEQESNRLIQIFDFHTVCLHIFFVSFLLLKWWCPVDCDQFKLTKSNITNDNLRNPLYAHLIFSISFLSFFCLISFVTGIGIHLLHKFPFSKGVVLHLFAVYLLKCIYFRYSRLLWSVTHKKT